VSGRFGLADWQKRCRTLLSGIDTCWVRKTTDRERPRAHHRRCPSRSRTVGAYKLHTSVARSSWPAPVRRCSARLSLARAGRVCLSRPVAWRRTCCDCEKTTLVDVAFIAGQAEYPPRRGRSV